MKDKKKIIIAILASLLCLQTCSKCNVERQAKFSNKAQVESIDSLYKERAQKDSIIESFKNRVMTLQDSVMMLVMKDSINNEVIKSLRQDKSNLNKTNTLLLKKENKQ